MGEFGGVGTSGDLSLGAVMQPVRLLEPEVLLCCGWVEGFGPVDARAMEEKVRKLCI